MGTFGVGLVFRLKSNQKSASRTCPGRVGGFDRAPGGTASPRTSPRIRFLRHALASVSALFRNFIIGNPRRRNRRGRKARQALGPGRTDLGKPPEPLPGQRARHDGMTRQGGHLPNKAPPKMPPKNENTPCTSSIHPSTHKNHGEES